MQRTLLVFTGGGLAPALNATLYGVITRARAKGFRVLGGVAGWQCVVDPKGVVIDLTHRNIESIQTHGGTFLRSSRTNPFKSRVATQTALDRLFRLHVDALVAIGGDDTLGAAARLARRYAIPVVGVPKTIDNDLPGTYWTPGYPSAAHYYSSFVREIREYAAYALKRIFVIEAQGRNSGWVAAAGAFGGADLVVVPEHRANLTTFLRRLRDIYTRNGHFATVAISEEANFTQPLQRVSYGLTDDYGVKRNLYVSLSLAQRIQEALGVDTKAIFPVNYVQTGDPTPIDCRWAKKLGAAAVDQLAKGKGGLFMALDRPRTSSMTIRIRPRPLESIRHTIRRLPKSYYDPERFQVRPAFYDYLRPILGAPPKQTAYDRLLVSILKPNTRAASHR